MEVEEEALLEPLSPTGQYLSTSNLPLCIIAVLEFEIPIGFDDSQAMGLIRDVVIPINPRLSSIMVVNKNGEKRWKKVEVNIEDHVKAPIFPAGNSTKFYDDCLNEYISKIAMEQLPQSQPLWDVHIIRYPTSGAAGNMIFKLHHSLGDGFSLMSALLSCLQRADNPSIPLTFPSAQIHTNIEDKTGSKFRVVTKIFSSIYNILSDFCSSLIKCSSLVEDDLSPIRSGNPRVEFLPVATLTMSFSLDRVKQIKTKLGVTINDVITGTIFLGTRLYMEAITKGSGKTCTTSSVLLNTRKFREYKHVQEMLKPNAELPWGNHFAFLSIPIPKLTGSEPKDPLKFIWEARKIIQRKRNSFSVILTAKYLQLLGKCRGPQAAAKHLHGTLKDTSMTISNVMGPREQMALRNHPISGLYFVVTGFPQSIMTGVVSYMGRLGVAALIEKNFIDPQMFKSHVEDAFDMIYAAACGPSLPANKT